jgi:hypothetical protein
MRLVPVLSVLATVVVATACGPQKPAGDRDTRSSATGTDYAGLYRIKQHNEPARCAPQALPPPAPPNPADTAEYLKLGSGDSSTFYVRETHDGTRLTSVVSMDSAMKNPDPPFTGTIQPDGSWSIDRTMAVGREGGPRKGGQRFFLEQVMNVRGTHEKSPEGVRETATGTAAYHFRADSAGPVFTTCTITFTASGTRVAP